MIVPFLIAWFATKLNCHQGHVIAYLREENRILKAKLKGKRIPLTDVERRRQAVLAHPIARKDLKDLSTIATPNTLKRWYRCLVVQAPSPALPGKRLLSAPPVPSLLIPLQGQVWPIEQKRGPPDAATFDLMFASRHMRSQRDGARLGLVPSTGYKSQSNTISDQSRPQPSLADSDPIAA